MGFRRRLRARAIRSTQSPACPKMAGSVGLDFRPIETASRQCSVDNILRIWDTATGACTQTLEGHSGTDQRGSPSHPIALS